MNTPTFLKKEDGSQNNQFLERAVKEIEKNEDEQFQDPTVDELEYIQKKIHPVLSKMMIKIINEDPKNVIEFMIEFLKNEEKKSTSNNFEEEFNKVIGKKKLVSATRKIENAMSSRRGEISSKYTNQD